MGPHILSLQQTEMIVKRTRKARGQVFDFYLKFKIKDLTPAALFFGL
jgi:hypothetical protein